MNEKIMGLSWKQPFASLMLHGKIETRTWKTNYRGLVLICASQSPYSNNMVFQICGEKQFQRIQKVLQNETLVFGCAIAIGRLVDCRPMQSDDEDKCFVRYNPDLFCHIYEDVKAIEPIPLKGKQGWMTINSEILDKIKYK